MLDFDHLSWQLEQGSIKNEEKGVQYYIKNNKVNDIHGPTLDFKFFTQKSLTCTSHLLQLCALPSQEDPTQESFYVTQAFRFTTLRRKVGINLLPSNDSASLPPQFPPIQAAEPKLALVSCVFLRSGKRN